MILLVLLQLSILAIAGFVTYASVYGLGALFSSIAVPVMVAGAALEAGKYVAVSYAYQYWGRLRKLEVGLLLFFVTLMMAFTSAGVFAYLGQGFQSSFAVLEQKQTQLEQLESQRSTTAARIASIDQQITQLPANVVRGRVTLIREYESEKKPLVAALAKADSDILELKKVIGETKIHAGPITYIAEAFKVPVSTAATWIILALTVCLDPFALFLSVLMNKVLQVRRQEAVTRSEILESSAVPHTPTKEAPPSAEPSAESFTFPEIDKPRQSPPVVPANQANVHPVEPGAIGLHTDVQTGQADVAPVTEPAAASLIDLSHHTEPIDPATLGEAIANTNTVIQKGGLKRN